MTDHNAKTWLLRMELGTPGIFGVADYECELKIQNSRSNMAKEF